MKHCLDLVAVVASAAPLHLGGPAAAGGGQGGEDSCKEAGLREALRVAADAVLDTARVTCDVRLQVGCGA